jgi:hypothetical protein
MVLAQSKFLLVVAAALCISVGAFSPSSYSPASVSSLEARMLMLAHLFGRILMGYDQRVEDTMMVGSRKRDSNLACRRGEDGNSSVPQEQLFLWQHMLLAKRPERHGGEALRTV